MVEMVILFVFCMVLTIPMLIQEMDRNMKF